MSDMKKVMVTVRMDPELWERIGEMAHAHRRSRSDLIRLLLEDALDTQTEHQDAR
jgi:predicted transcriptional regulator